MNEVGRRFRFAGVLERKGTLFSTSVPVRISKALGRRGPIPVVARIAGKVEVLVSLVPAGGGRHRININAKTRAAAGINEGDTIRIEIAIPASPIEVHIPGDLADELQADGVYEAFKSLPVGKQNHIIEWIVDAAHEKTRAKRIQMALEVAHRKRDKAAR